MFLFLSKVKNKVILMSETTFQKAIDLGCDPLQHPMQKAEDPDRRGGFVDFAGNSWWISTQVNEAL